MKRAFVTGVCGQDGSYLSELLLAKGYEVHGMMRRASTFNTSRIDHIYQDPITNSATKFHLHFGDLTDASSIRDLLQEIQPDEIYNLGAQSHVAVSFKIPEYTVDVVATGTVRLLDAYRRICPWARFYQASSSEMFGAAPPPQSEETPFQPLSPYACAKTFAHYAAINYRRAYGLHVSCGILFNHESPRRAETFVTRKISRAATRIKLGIQNELYLGNLDAKRDWGHAEDYVQAMYLMLQQPDPQDFVIATGYSYSVRDFLNEAFGKCLNLEWQKYVKQHPRYFRPSEVDALQGDATKARQKLGWEPVHTFQGIVRQMVQSDLAIAVRESRLQ